MTDETPPRQPNRRLTARRACLLSVKYRTDGGWHPATVMNLSTSGCRLRLGEDLRLGSGITVRFERPSGDGANGLAAEVPGTVTWARIDGLSHAVGIHFKEPPPTLEDLLAAIA
jgi:hypothetical protein